MRFHTALTEPEIRECLERAKADDVPADIVFDIFGAAGSRSHPNSFEIHLATARNDTRADGVRRKASSMAGGSGLRYAATWDEWGMFLAEFFAADPEAKAGRYKGRDHFHASTRYAYAMRDEMPEDARPAGPEPDPERAAEYVSTAPTTDARLPVIKQIDDALAGCWVNNLNP